TAVSYRSVCLTFKVCLKNHSCMISLMIRNLYLKNLRSIFFCIIFCVVFHVFCRPDRRFCILRFREPVLCIFREVVVRNCTVWFRRSGYEKVILLRQLSSRSLICRFVLFRIPAGFLFGRFFTDISLRRCSRFPAGGIVWCVRRLCFCILYGHVLYPRFLFFQYSSFCFFFSNS